MCINNLKFENIYFKISKGDDFMKKILILLIVLTLCGCSNSDNKRIVRISHVQSETHPIHVGLLAFEKYVEDNLGDRYDVQIYPNELLGAQVKTVELCQTGAIDFTVASIAILESFDDVYEIFNLPYLFDSEKHYYSVMEDNNIMTPIYKSTDESGFEAVAWYDAGTRNFYTTKKAINTPQDLKGLKVRVQQSATNVRMMELFNAAAAPMSFGEVYTALQQHVIDGAENNELALINNKHGEVAKHYSYNKHQMVPDILIGNIRFLNNLDEEERAVFDQAAEISTEVERENWAIAVEEAKRQAENMGVNFYYPDIKPFQNAVLKLHEEVLQSNDKLPDIYKAIKAKGEIVKEEEENAAA